MSLSTRIKFRCSSCDKPLSIGRRKAGAKVTCPKCKASIVVPLDSELEDPEDSRENPFGEFEVYDEFDEPELIYEEDSAGRKNDKPALNGRISISRKLVYFQGALLGIVAIVFFLLGLIAGSTDSTPSSQKNSRSNVRGRVLLANNTVDEGAVVFLLPSGSGPETRFETEELLVGRSFTSSNPEVPLIRRFGGNVSTVNQAGQFQLSVKPNREYSLVIISANGTRTGELDPDLHSEVGHYFTSLDDLTEGRSFFFKKVMPLGKTLDLGDLTIRTGG